ncbi:MAG: hypothetical protein AB7T49_00175 [Oligoflexales bacterium]
MASTIEKFARNLLKLLLITTILQTISSQHCHAESLTMFQQNYIGLESVTNYPIIHTSEKFSTGKASLSLNYQHVLDDYWLMKLNAHLKNLVNKENNQQLNLASVSHTAYYIIRLYADTYLLVGPKFSYLYPTKGLQFPAKRNPDFDTNVEAAASLAFSYFPAKKWIANARIDRWRGTATNEFHGYELGIGISYSIF